MHVNNTKFERNTSQEYHHITCIDKQNTQAKEVYSSALPHLYNVPAQLYLHSAIAEASFGSSPPRSHSCSDT